MPCSRLSAFARGRRVELRLDRRVFVLAFALLAVASGRTIGADTPRVTNDDVVRWMKELSNWGRWGKDDQRGTLNLITAEKRKQSLRLVRDGIAVSLAHTIEKDASADNPRPLGQQMTLDNAGHAMDLYSIWYHGSTITHIDSLCHYSFEGKLYNGFERAKIAQGPGCPQNGVEHQKNGIMPRGVLITSFTSPVSRRSRLPHVGYPPSSASRRRSPTAGSTRPATRPSSPPSRCSPSRCAG